MFSLDTETGFDRIVLINAAWGLGENVVQGAVDPDEYVVFKPLLANSEAEADRREAARRQGDQDDLRRRRREAGAQRADLEGRARGVRALRRRDPAARALGRDHREALRLPDGHGVGQGRRDRRDVHRPGAARDGAVAPRGRHLPSPTRSRRRARRSSRASASATPSSPGASASSRTSRTSTSSSMARCSSPP